MQVDALAIQLRPRSMPEACDLGVLLAHRHARSVWSCYLPVFLAVLVLAAATIELAPWAPTLVVFWLKPWMDRTLLFVLSRAVFGQSTRPRDVWAHRSTVLFGQLFSTLVLRRLSPWRSYTQPALQLEGQRGAARRKRRDQLLKGKRNAATLLQFVFGNCELAVLAGLMAMAVWFAPEGARGGVLPWLANSSGGLAHDSVMLGIYALAVLLVEPFFVAAGFAMYLNRRVELEAWDIEQEFRRAFAA